MCYQAFEPRLFFLSMILLFGELQLPIEYFIIGYYFLRQNILNSCRLMMGFFAKTV